MSADPARVAAARQMLAHLGVTMADLQADPGPGLPTLAEYLPQVIAAAGAGCPPHLRHLLEPDGHRVGRTDTRRGRRH